MGQSAPYLYPQETEKPQSVEIAAFFKDVVPKAGFK
jgi:hypothetical protein